MRVFLTLILTLFVSTIFGQTITGNITDELNKPLPYVSILVKGTSIGTTSDSIGNYKLKLPNTNVEVVFSFTGYQEYKILTSGGEYNVNLKPKPVLLGDVRVVASRDKRDEAVLISDKKNSVNVESSIGNTELTKKGISNAEDGLKKVSGITFNNNRLNIRGLDDRYNQVTLNGLPIPSNNSDKKNIDLNILPTNVLDNIKVKKSYSSEQWSNIAGAQINITSPDIRDVFDISLRTSINTLTPIPSSNFNLKYGLSKKQFGILFNVGFINDWQNTSGVIRLTNKQGNSVLDYNFKDRVYNLTPSSILVLNYNTKNFTLKNTTLFVSQLTKTNRETFGTHFDYSNQIFTQRITPTYNTLITNQINGKWKNDDWFVEGIGGYSFVTSGEDGRQQFVYLYNGDYRFNNIDKLDNHVLWSQNTENRVNLNITGGWSNKKIKLESGYIFQYSKNFFDYQQKYYDLNGVNNEVTSMDPTKPNDYLTDSNHVVLWVNNPASKVEGSTLINGGYFKSTFNLKKFDLSTGVRIESVRQIVNYKDQLSPTFTKQSLLQNVDVLPFISSKYKINEKLQIKFNNSITTIRPRFREMVPFIYTEVFAGSKIQGNPNLINSTVYNSDLSLEYYPSNKSLISLTTFGKVVQNPIERVNVATASGRLETYQNSKIAYILGTEVEFKKKISDFTIDFNFTYIWSQIQISNNGSATVVASNNNRPLQGSTPILLNTDLFYTFKKSHNFGLVYNYVGEKLNSVGIFGMGDVYQSNQHLLNFVYNYEKDKYSFSFRVNNLFNTPFELKQKTDIGDKVLNNFTTGQEFVVSFKYKIKS